MALGDVFPSEDGLIDFRRSDLDRGALSADLHDRALEMYDLREEQLGEELMRALERYLLLQIIDDRWREHLYDMDYLRNGIGLRGHAQIDPLVAYKNESFELFKDLMNSIWADFARMIFRVQVEIEGPNGDAPQQQYTPSSGSSTRAGRVSYSGGGEAAPSALAVAAAGAGEEYAEAPEPVQQRRVEAAEQIGRNDPCWCGSGKKFKKCHGA
jgi:preprotein translocase subunit SecA